MKFKSPKIKCLNCKQIIYSSYPGEYVVCNCKIESNKLQDQIYKTIKEYLPDLIVDKDSKYDMETKAGHLIRCALAKHLDKGIMLDATTHYYRTSGRFEVVEDGEQG